MSLHFPYRSFIFPNKKASENGPHQFLSPLILHMYSNKGKNVNILASPFFHIPHPNTRFELIPPEH